MNKRGQDVGINTNLMYIILAMLGIIIILTVIINILRTANGG